MWVANCKAGSTVKFHTCTKVLLSLTVYVCKGIEHSLEELTLSCVNCISLLEMRLGIF